MSKGPLALSTNPKYHTLVSLDINVTDICDKDNSNTIFKILPKEYTKDASLPTRWRWADEIEERVIVAVL